MVATLTTDNGRKIDPALAKLIALRSDPRKVGREPDEKDFIGHLANTTKGRKAFSKAIYVLRLRVLVCSFEVLGELVVEDQRRKLLIAGEPIDEVNKLKVVTASTIWRAEDNVGNMGTNSKTIALLTPRLLNPLTHEPYSALDLQGLCQDLVEVPDLDLFDTTEYRQLSTRLNQKVDRDLFYVIPPYLLNSESNDQVDVELDLDGQ